MGYRLAGCRLLPCRALMSAILNACRVRDGKQPAGLRRCVVAPLSSAAVPSRALDCYSAVTAGGYLRMALAGLWTMALSCQNPDRSYRRGDVRIILARQRGTCGIDCAPACSPGAIFADVSLTKKVVDHVLAVACRLPGAARHRCLGGQDVPIRVVDSGVWLRKSALCICGEDRVITACESHRGIGHTCRLLTDW